MPVLLQKRSRLVKPKQVGYSGFGGGVYSEDDLAGFWGAKFPVGNTTSGVNVTVENSMTFSAVYAARSVIARTLGCVPIKVIKKKELRGREVSEKVPDHPVSRCLARYPNTDQTPLLFKEQIGMDLTGWGNFFAEINWGGPRLYLHPLQASRVTVCRDSNGQLEYHCSSDDGSTVRLPQAKVIHVPLFGDGVVGKSPVQLARESLGMGIAAERFGGAFFANGLSPSGVLMHPGKLDHKGRTNLRNAFESRHQGPGRAGKMMLLEEGLKYEQVGIPQKDAQFLETRQFQVLEVARWFGVPPHMLGDSSQAKWANITQYAIEFLKYTMAHYFKRIEEEINRKILWPQDESLYVKFEEWALLRGDSKEQLESMVIGMANGIYSLNDVLALLDLNPIDHEAGNIHWVTRQHVPIEVAMNPPEAEAPDDEEDPDEEPTETEETSDEETERSLTVIGEPRTITAADEAKRVIFRDAAGRIVAHELKAIKTLSKHNQKALPVAAGHFFDHYEPEVIEILGPAWRSASLLDGRSVDVERTAKRYVADVRQLVMGAVAGHTLPTLVEVWANGRADQVVTQYMELN